MVTVMNCCDRDGLKSCHSLVTVMVTVMNCCDRDKLKSCHSLVTVMVTVMHCCDRYSQRHFSCVTKLAGVFAKFDLCTLAVMYLQRGPPIAENNPTTHRTHRTQYLRGVGDAPGPDWFTVTVIVTVTVPYIYTDNNVTSDTEKRLPYVSTSIRWWQENHSQESRSCMSWPHDTCTGVTQAST